MLELRDQILNLFTPAGEGEQPKPQYSKLVTERLCMCVAYLALHTTNSIWKSSVPDLIAFGSRFGPQQCFVALNVLKNVCITFEIKMLDVRTTSLIKRWFIEYVGTVFQFVQQIMQE